MGLGRYGDGMPDVTLPAATYAELAAERRSIVLREDSDWDRHGFTATEAAAWIANGIPAEHAPLAAVARDVKHFPGATPVPELLKRSIAGRSILEMVLDGMDSAAIERYVTTTTGQFIEDGGNDGVWRRAPLGGPNLARIKPPLARRLREADDRPSRVPEVMDALDGWFDANIAAFYGNGVIATEAIDYLGHNQPTDALRRLTAYISAHGVTADDDENIRRLIAATPASQGVQDMILGGAAIFSGNVSRILFHLDAREHRALREAMAAYQGNTALDLNRLPAADGFVFLAGHAETNLPATILGWISNMQGAAFTTGHVSLNNALAASMRGEVTPVEEVRVAHVATGETSWSPENEWSAEAFALLLALADVMEVRGVANTSSEPPDTTRARDRNATQWRPREVNLVYRRKTPIKPSAAGVQPREWTHRWPVRGFWRRQWYPSLQEHRMVWVAAHTRGPEDAPLIARRQVNVITGAESSDRDSTSTEEEVLPDR